MPIKNPWENFKPSNGRCILNIDEGAVEKINDTIGKSRIKHKDQYVIHTDLLPEPFWGDLKKANVYVLNGNPGYHKEDDNFKDNAELKEVILDNLSQKNPRFLWLEDGSIADQNGNPHPGYNWWKMAAKKIKEYASQQEKSLNICNIEYFPYHSQKMYSKIKEGKVIKSNEYIDSIIQNAMNKNKWIVVVRCKTEWFNRIKGLRNYKKLLIGSSQRVYLTQKNLKMEFNLEDTEQFPKIPTWNEFLEACCI